MRVRRTAVIVFSLLTLAALAGTAAPSANAAASGWAGEQLFGSGTNDDWEPAVAAASNSGYVYMATTRYGGPKACQQCPDPAIVLRVSADGGATFGPASYICACRGTKAQNDPELEVATDGTVYAVWMNDYNPGVVFSRSSDHGQTWTPPIPLKGKGMSWTDKPILAISPSGQDVYVAFNKSDSYVSASHNYGASFSAPYKTNSDSRYHFAGGGAVLPNGTVVFSESSLTTNSTGPVFILSIRSANNGASWIETLIDTVEQQPACISAGCPADYYGPMPALGADANNRLVMIFPGATFSQGAQRVFVKRSTDGGATWTARQDVSASTTASSAFVAAVGRGNGDFRVWFMDNQNGATSWNVWYRASTDAGATWSAPVRISDAGAVAPYKNANGFTEGYGDYGEVAITSVGTTFAAWGEGPSYDGPGGTWYNRQL